MERGRQRWRHVPHIDRVMDRHSEFHFPSRHSHCTRATSAMAPNDLSSPCARDDRLVFFFDTSPLLSLLRADCVHLDNCLYPKSMKIHDMMVVKIRQYFMKHLKITDEEAEKLHNEYYKSYGLALEGLVRHHKIGTLSPPYSCACCRLMRAVDRSFGV